MAIGVRFRMSRLLDVGEAKTAFGRALLRERYRALQRQIPLLYGIALINFLGLHFVSGEPTTALIQPVTLLALFAVVRLVYWLRLHGRVLAPERILVELKRTLFLAGLLSVAFGYSAISLYGQLPGSERHLVILFASMAAVGCAYGLTSFPAAARLPLLLFALPFAARLVASGNAAHAGVGISIGLITMMILRLVNLHNESFVQLVWSRSEVETERERAQRAEQIALAEKARVRQVADTDSLTDLANRRAFIAELETRLGSPGMAPPFALALLDLDGFKPINDTFGHAAGDSVLIEVAARLRGEGGAGALVARIGGDEFALILPCGNETALKRAGERICAALEQPYRVGAREFRISACCGLTLLAPGGDVTTALSQGDAALYSGKQRGGLPRQGRGTRPGRLVHAGDRRGQSAAHLDRAGAARPAGEPRVQPRLPAGLRPRQRRAARVRSAGAMAAPDSRGDHARRVHPDHRTDQRHRADQRRPARPCLRRGGALAGG